MSLALTLQNALSGLNAAQGGLGIVSNNVANANTVGYSRQVPRFEQRVIDGEGSGVELSGAERVVDQFLVRELRAQRSETGFAEARATFFEEMQARFGTPEDNATIANDLAEFAATLDTLATNPEDPAIRFAVIAAAKTLAKDINDLANGAQELRGRADQETKAAVDRVNVQLRLIDELNAKITRAVAAGADTAALEDERDRALGVVAENIDIKTFARDDGAISILTRNGQTLLDNELHRLDYTPAATINATTTFGPITVTPIDPETGSALGSSETLVSSGTSSAVTSNFVSGRIEGLRTIRDGALADFAAQLDTLADAVRQQYNAVSNTGTSFPAPNTVTGTRTVAGPDAFEATGTVRIAVVGANGLVQGTPLDLDLTALGATTVDGLITAINAGLGADATASIVNGNLEITATNPVNGIAINEANTQVTGSTEAFSHFFGLNDFFTGTGAGDFAVRSSLAADPSLIPTGQLSTTATTGQPGITAGDNRVIQQLASVTETGVGFASVGGLVAGTFTLGEYAGTITGFNAAQATAAKADAALQNDLLDNVEHRTSSFSGVNVDEEMSNMIIFQNAFTANARLISTTEELFDILVNM